MLDRRRFYPKLTSMHAPDIWDDDGVTGDRVSVADIRLLAIVGVRDALRVAS